MTPVSTGMRKTAIIAFVALALASAPIQQGVSLAQPANAMTMVSSLSPADKDALIKKLQEARKHDKIARAGWSQEPITQRTYDYKIDEIDDLIDKLGKGEEFPLSDADQAVASPHSAPY